MRREWIEMGLVLMQRTETAEVSLHAEGVD